MYIHYILSSNIDIRYPSSMRHQPPIVALEEIRSAKDLCPHSMGGCKIFELNASTILKVGPTVRMGEAEALCLLRKRTSVSVPEVFKAYIIANIGFILISKNPRCHSRTLLARFDSRCQVLCFIQEWRQAEIFPSVMSHSSKSVNSIVASFIHHSISAVLVLLRFEMQVSSNEENDFGSGESPAVNSVSDV